LVRQVCVNDASSNTVILHHVKSSLLVTIDANSSVEAAADIIIQSKARHLLVVMDMEIDH
jgi:CBS domain-containing protein